METIETLVIGAGVVGLAVARRLALSGREVLIVEKAGSIGMETSSRNSEVIHAGLYYEHGSNKGRFCVEGRDFLYRYCAERGIAHKRCGKLVVATNADEIDDLRKLMHHAEGNGVKDLRWMERDDVLSLEPELDVAAGFLSPWTGIIDSHDLMLNYQGDAENAGATVSFMTEIVSCELGEDGHIVHARSMGEDFDFKAREIVNSAGFSAPPIAARMTPFPAELLPETVLSKGSYFGYQGRSPFTHLVYPLPSKVALGVHVTHDLGGNLKFGPDAEWVDEIDYTVDASKRSKFVESVWRYAPTIEEEKLQPDYAGMRPKIKMNGELYMDFLLQGPKDHGVPGLVHLFGIESPGLTSSPAIAEEVARLMGAD